MDFATRTRAGLPVTEPGFKEIYPSEYGSKTAKFLHDGPNVPASQGEPCRIRCAQCGALIPDYRKISKCWDCESDNFLGGNLM